MMESTLPKSGRRRWLRIFFLVLLALVFLVLVAWLLIPWDGPPYDGRDIAFQETPFTADSNGFDYYERAGKALGMSKEEQVWLASVRKGGPWDEQIADSLLMRLEPLMGLVRAGNSRPRCVGPLRVAYAEDLPSYLPQVRLARALLVRVLDSVRNGRDEQTLMALGDLLLFANHFERDANNFVNFNIGIIIWGYAGHAIRATIADTQLVPGYVKQLATLLQSQTPTHRGQQRALRCQYFAVGNLVDSLAREHRTPLDTDFLVPGWLSRVTVMRLFHPEDTKRELAWLYHRFILDAEQPVGRGVGVKDRLDFLEKTVEDHQNLFLLYEPNFLGKVFAVIHMPKFEHWNELFAAMKLEVQAGAIQCAIAAYHNRTGKLPARLDDLVPQELSVLPMDPFGGGPMCWIPESGKLYSLGSNLRDDGGSDAPLDSLKGNRWFDTVRREDILFMVPLGVQSAKVRS